MPRLKRFLSRGSHPVAFLVLLCLTIGSSGLELYGQAEPAEGITVFFFESETEDPDARWLQYGLPLALAVDLGQDPSLDVRSPPMFPDRLRRMGFQELVGVARSSGRYLARGQQQDWFVLGTVAQGEGLVHVKVALHPTGIGGAVVEHAYVGADVFALIDEISLDIRDDLGLPNSRGQPSHDRPVGEILTGNAEAFRFYSEGIRNGLGMLELPEAVISLERAVAADVGFGLAHHALSGLYVEMGRMSDAAGALREAMAQLDRMPERARFQVRADHSRVVENPAEALRELERWADLYPQDVFAHHAQAKVLSEMGDHDRALATLGVAFDAGSLEKSVLHHLGDSWLAKGDTAAALRYYQEYAGREPQWMGVFEALSEQARDRGDLEEARVHLHRSLLLAPDSSGVWAAFAAIESIAGKPEAAISLFEEGVARATTAEERTQALESLGSQLIGMGRSAKGMAFMEQVFEEAAEYLTELELHQKKLSLVRTLVIGGGEEEARSLMKEAREKYPDELEGALAIAGVQFFFDYGPADSLEVAYRTYKSVFPTPDGGRESMNDHFYMARIHEGRGEWREAIDRWLARKETGSPDRSFGMSIGPCYRELGEFDRAVEYIEEALAYYPNGPQTNLEMALTYEAMGRLEDARMHLERVMLWYSQAEEGHQKARVARELAARIGFEY